MGLQKTLKALADPIRREILDLLKSGRLRGVMAVYVLLPMILTLCLIPSVYSYMLYARGKR